VGNESNKLERRYTKELRAVGSGSGKKIGGLAAPYNSEAVIPGPFGDFREILKPGCFDRCLNTNPDVRAFYNHNSSVVLGRTRAQTLRLWTDTKGLNFEIDLPQTQVADELYESVKRGDITGCSFGMREVDDEWQQPAQRDDLPLRILNDVDFYEISPCAMPAYEASNISARNLRAMYWPDGLPETIERRSGRTVRSKDATDGLELRLVIAKMLGAK
jgi:uncharacterized protein